jgi:hypothetical protein
MLNVAEVVKCPIIYDANRMIVIRYDDIAAK